MQRDRPTVHKGRKTYTFTSPYNICIRVYVSADRYRFRNYSSAYGKLAHLRVCVCGVHEGLNVARTDVRGTSYT